MIFLGELQQQKLSNNPGDYFQHMLPVSKTYSSSSIFLFLLNHLNHKKKLKVLTIVFIKGNP